MSELSGFDRDKVPTPEGTPLADGETPQEVIFDEKWKDPFYGLAYLGAASRTFEWLGHKFVIRTLTTDEELIIASIIKDWKDTIGFDRAYYTAIAALAVETVDGRGLPTPIGEGPGYGWAIDRFNFVKARWFRAIIDKVAEQYLILESEVRAVLEEMGKAFGQEDQTPGLSESSASSTAEAS